MEDLISPELIEMVVPMLAGGFSAYHGIKIGLFVLGKFIERRKAKKQQEVEEENTKERRRLGRLLEIVGAVAEIFTQQASPETKTDDANKPEETATSETPADDPAEKVDFEEIIAKVINSIKKD